MLLIRGTELEIERVLTVKNIRIELETKYGATVPIQEVWYSFNESKFMYRQDSVIKKVNRR